MKAFLLIFFTGCVLASVPAATPSELDNWEITPFYVKNTSNSLGETLAHSEIDYVDTYALGLNVGRVVMRDVLDQPLDAAITVGTIWHRENGFQDDFLQHTVLFKWIWRSFPWNGRVRTIGEVGTGASFSWRIAKAEQENRSVGDEGLYKESRNLLNYNEFSLGFNLADIGELVSGGKNMDSLEKAWLMMGIVHRSGAWGFWGDGYNPESGEREGVQGAWNAYYLGVKKTF